MSVWHGHTKTTPASVQECLDVIKAKAFEHSPYPLLLLIELHVRDAQQESLVQMLTSTLGMWFCWARGRVHFI